MARFQHQYCEVDHDHYELSRVWEVGNGGRPYYTVRRLVSGGPQAEIVGKTGAWQARKEGNTDERKYPRLCHAVDRLRELGWVGKYR